jgi:hypothetical protein
VADRIIQQWPGVGAQSIQACPFAEHSTGSGWVNQHYGDISPIKLQLFAHTAWFWASIRERTEEGMRLSLVILALGILTSGAGLSQEVRYIDLSSITDSVGHELPPGSMIESSSCVGLRGSISQRVGISLEWMETTDLYPRQRVGAEFRVENIGTTPLRLPIHPTLTDLQPKDLATPFAYYRMTLPLVAGIPAEGFSLVAGGLELYGSMKRPDTFLTLMPGESIRVKGDVGVRRWYTLDQAITVSTALELSKFKYSKKKKFIPSNSQCRLEWSEPGAPLNAYMHAEPPTTTPPSTACTSTSQWCLDRTVH